MKSHRQEYYSLNKKPNRKVWVIAFLDGDNLHYWKNEIYKNGEFNGYGNVKTFKTEELCEKFIVFETDSHAYDFYSTQITREVLDKYEEEMK